MKRLKRPGKFRFRQPRISNIRQLLTIVYINGPLFIKSNLTIEKAAYGPVVKKKYIRNWNTKTSLQCSTCYNTCITRCYLSLRVICVDGNLCSRLILNLLHGSKLFFNYAHLCFRISLAIFIFSYIDLISIKTIGRLNLTLSLLRKIPG